VSVERAERPLEELALPPALARECVDSLREPPRDGRPVRLVVAGRRGSGRTSLIAALAARAELPITLIDAERLAKNSLIEQLRAELSRAALRGTLPVVSGLEFVQTEDDQQEDRVRDVLVSHPGPLAVRSSREQRPPLNPGYLMFTIPPLGEAERLEFWQRALARRGLAAERPEALASRFRFGAGTIETVIDSVVSRLDPVLRGTDMSDQLEATARQHIDSRLGAVAQRIDRLAGWEQVALPDDILDSVREFIGRLRHRRTVYDTWGFDRKLSTARGLTALFYGPPGTGKTMVAGLIARELGLELYRVDLARITSKWIGETEKNLAEIFDAAEDGQAIILFDEADSLFAKRTEVKSSVDRYANLEVNYLLQRFDTFEGVAVLTTNFEGAIDRAFKRRLSLRLAFPFPDAEMRVRLWAAHVPPEVPNAGDFDFEYLAKRYPMSGGYIRNCVVRAAFLAASEGAALSQEHLARVIELEYRESGKLSKTSRLE
jgi:AAA+ superfamily predicted ATPase